MIPGRSVRVVARLASPSRSFPATCRRSAARAPRDGDADPRSRAIDRARRGRPSGPPGDGSCSCSAARRPSGGSTPRSRRSHALVERVGVIHVAGTEGMPRRRRARALPEALRDRYRPDAFLRAGSARARRGRSRRRTSGIVDARRGGRVRAADGRSRIRTPATTSGANAETAWRRRRGGPSTTSSSTRPRCWRSRASSASQPATRPCAAARDLGRPGAADAVAEIVLALAGASRCPTPGGDRRDRHAGAARGRHDDRGRRRPVRRVALAGEIARRVGVKAARDEPLGKLTTMRVGGPADLLATAHNAFELRGLVRFARARALPLTVLGRGSNVVISDAGVRGLVVHVRAEGSRIDGTRTCRGRPPDGACRHRDPEGRPVRARVRACDPGVGRGRGLGQRRGPRCGRRASSNRRRPARRRQRGALPAAELGFAYRESRFKHQARRVARGGRDRRALPLAPASEAEIKARLDDIRHWRQEHQPLGIPSAGSAFRNPDEGSAGRPDRGGGAQGPPGGRGDGLREARQLHRQRSARDGRGRAPPAGPRPRDVLDRHGVDLVPEIVFVGDWAGWPWTPPPDGRGAA